MPVFSVVCHHCFNKSVIIGDRAPGHCPYCKWDITDYVNVLDNSTDLNQYK